MPGLALLFGAIVGFSLGLTGGGGSIFAVPLLVFGLAVAPNDAVGISLIAVGLVALAGVLRRLRGHEVEFRAGMLMAVGGVVGAPFGSWFSRQLPGYVLLVAFAALMIVIAVLMWRSSRRPALAKEVPEAGGEPEAASGVACRFEPAGKLKVTSRCAIGLTGVGLLTGVLSGLFGVGGGFLIVPALMFATGMTIHRAVATSLLVIFLVSVSGSAAYIVGAHELPLRLLMFFLLGGFAGLELGGRAAKRISGPLLQRGFAAAILIVGVYVITRTLVRA